MRSQTYELKFGKAYREDSINELPNESGIYLVFRGEYKENNSIIGLEELIYVGETQNVYNRFQNHGMKGIWNRELIDDQELFYFFAPIIDDRERVEATMIFYHQPVCNTNRKSSFDYDTTRVTILGSLSDFLGNIEVP